MLRDVETVAKDSELYLLSRDGEWSVAEDWPHIATFRYQLARRDPNTESFVPVGTADGYRITQDWTVRAATRTRCWRSPSMAKR